MQRTSDAAYEQTCGGPKVCIGGGKRHATHDVGLRFEEAVARRNVKGVQHAYVAVKLICKLLCAGRKHVGQPWQCLLGCLRADDVGEHREKTDMAALRPAGKQLLNSRLQNLAFVLEGRDKGNKSGDNLRHLDEHALFDRLARCERDILRSDCMVFLLITQRHQLRLKC